MQTLSKQKGKAVSWKDGHETNKHFFFIAPLLSSHK